MQIHRSDLADLTYFLVIARHRNFRVAGLELGVSTSALSHSLKGLEARLGVRLLNRSNRSVTLTAAGEELQAAIGAPFGAIGEAMESLNRFRDAPAGRIRLNVVPDAAELVLAPILPIFVERYPHIEIDIAASNRMMDVVEGGFDAGIRYGGTVPEDMIAQRLSADVRWTVVAAPAYLERRGVPKHPSDLLGHSCIRIRLGDGSIYKWDFEKDGEEIAIEVPGKFTIDETRTALALLTRGLGLLIGAEPVFAPMIASGALVPVLSEWATMGPGYYMYYSSRRQLPTGLRLLIDLIRELRPLGL